MTKFEEEFKALTSWDWVNVDLIQQILTRFGNWHSDEEFQDMKAIGGSFALANQNLIDDNKKLVKEIANLKSQLQQQALPVVPDFIGKLINTFGAPEDGKYINYSASYLENQKELDWIDNHQKTWLTALLIGFTVEKPQLFYLREKNTGYYLRKKGNNEYGITP
ncbi:DUF1642 domain-containing protein, partial [Lactococcus lactis]|uniref:DUF1642 domain-containing protein n=1 Tax=Lactococcus lactis TaxID=1358 RepID=UPI0021A3854D